MKIFKLTRLISLTAALLLLTLTLSACQKNNPNENAYKNIQDSSNALIPVEEDEFEDQDYLFSNGLLSVQINGKHGYIDEQGNVVIEPQFDYADVFNSDGTACVRKKNKCFFIDKQGNQVGTNTFDDLEGPYEGYYITNSKSVKQGIVNSTGNYIFKLNNWKYEIVRDGSWLPNMVVIEKDMKYGLMDLNGNVVVEPQYNELDWMTEEGLALVETVEGKYGFIDITGKVVIDLQYDYACSFSDELKGLAFVRKGKKAGYINIAGEMIHEIPRNRDYNTWYPDVEGTFDENGLAVVCQKGKKGKMGMIDRDGNYVIPPKFEDLWRFAENGLAPACIDKKYGYIDKTGNFVIEPKFKETFPFEKNGLAMVEVNKKSGFINADGKFVIPPIYESFGDWFDGNIWALTGNKLTLLNESGNIVKEFDIKYLVDGGIFASNPDGYAVFINENKKYVIANINGEIIGEYEGYKYNEAKWDLCQKPNCYNHPWDEWFPYCKKHS